MDDAELSAPAAAAEPPKPERGLMAAERGRDVSEAQAAAEAHRSRTRRTLALMGPRFYFSQAEGYPGPVKWFLWFAMVWVYPVWVVTIPLAMLIGWVGRGVGHVLLWIVVTPVRLWMKRYRPEQLAAWEEEQRQKKQQQSPA